MSSLGQISRVKYVFKNELLVTVNNSLVFSKLYLDCVLKYFSSNSARIVGSAVLLPIVYKNSSMNNFAVWTVDIIETLL